MAGLDVGEQLRKSLGRGQVLSAEALSDLLANHAEPDDPDQIRFDGLVSFLTENRFAGGFLCRVVARGVWKTAENQHLQPQHALSRSRVAQVLHSAMASPPRPERRYRIEPDALRGLKPLEDLDGKPIHRPRPGAAPSAPSTGEPTAGSSASPRSGPTPRKPKVGSPAGPRVRPRTGPMPRRGGPKPRGP